jgi:hypothetical protein
MIHRGLALAGDRLQTIASYQRNLPRSVLIQQATWLAGTREAKRENLACGAAARRQAILTLTPASLSSASATTCCSR